MTCGLIGLNILALISINRVPVNRSSVTAFLILYFLHQSLQNNNIIEDMNYKPIKSVYQKPLPDEGVTQNASQQSSLYFPRAS